MDLCIGFRRDRFEKGEDRDRARDGVLDFGLDTRDDGAAVNVYGMVAGITMRYLEDRWHYRKAADQSLSM